MFGELLKEENVEQVLVGVVCLLAVLFFVVVLNYQLQIEELCQQLDMYVVAEQVSQSCVKTELDGYIPSIPQW